MTAPAIPQTDPVLDRAKQLRAAGATIDEVKQYLAAKGYHADDDAPSIPAVKPDVTSALPRNRENPSGDYEVLGKGIAANVLNAAQGIPGMERFEAGMGALGSRIPGNGPPLSYQESLAALRSQTSKIPAAISVPERVLGGGGVVARAIGPIASAGKAFDIGAGLGAADQAFSADSMSADQRVRNAMLGGAAGGILGGVLGAAPSVINKGRELVSLGKRVSAAPTAGAEALAMKNATSDIDAANYGRAEAQGAAHQTSPALQEALEYPRVKPYADMIRSSEDFGGADDATVARETYKLMSEERLGIQEQIEKNGRTAELNMKDRNLAAAQKRLKDATAEISFKPPIHLDIAGENTTVQPQITPGREAMRGPIPGADVTTVPFKYAGARNEAGLLRQNLSEVPTEALHAEWQRLAELNGTEEAAHGAVQEAGYRGDYNQLPRTERLGRRGQEDLPDADGTVDPQTLLADNQTVAAYGRGALGRRARQQAMDRIEAEIQRRPPEPLGEDEDTAFDFGSNVKRLGPPGPAFQLRAQPGKIVPGVQIQTPAMRIETAPPQRVPPVMAAFPRAVAEHAANAKDAEQFQTGYDEARQLMSGKVLKGTDLATKSPEAIAQRISTMPSRDAQNYLRGLLSSAKTGIAGAPITPHGTAFGNTIGRLIQPAQRLNTLSPFVRSLDVQTGRKPFQPADFSQTLARLLGAGNAGFTNGQPSSTP